MKNPEPVIALLGIIGLAIVFLFLLIKKPEIGTPETDVQIIYVALTGAFISTAVFFGFDYLFFQG